MKLLDLRGMAFVLTASVALGVSGAAADVETDRALLERMEAMERTITDQRDEILALRDEGFGVV